MNKTIITAILVAVVFGGGGYYFGKQASASATPTGAAAFAGRTGAPGGTGRFGGGAGGGFTTGTIISTGSGTMTIQMPTSTSTSATTGTKIVILDANTVISELQTVPTTNLAVGQSVTVSGTSNSDGSVTATSIQVRPARAGSPAGGVPPAGQ